MAKTVHFMFHVYVTTTSKSVEWKRGGEEGRFSGCPGGRGGFARRPAPHSPRRQLTGGHVPSPGAARPRERARSSALAQHLPRWGRGRGRTSCTTNRPLVSGGTQGGARAQARTPPGRPTRSWNSGLRTSAHERRGSGGPRPPGPRRSRPAGRTQSARPARPRDELRARALPAYHVTGRSQGTVGPAGSAPARYPPGSSPRPLRSDPRRPRARTHVRVPVPASAAAAGLEPLRTEWAGRTG